MWLHFCIKDKVGLSIIVSIPHCNTENASKLGSKMSKTKTYGFVSIKKTLFGGKFIIISIPLSFDSIIFITVWNTKETMNFKCPLYRNVATFLAFCSFKKHFQYGISMMIDTSTLCSI